jgi:2'-5' RNA ligase
MSDTNQAAVVAELYRRRSTLAPDQAAVVEELAKRYNVGEAAPAVDFAALAKKYGGQAVETVPGMEQLGGVPPGPAPLPSVVKPITAGSQIRHEWAKQPGGVEAVESRLAESNQRFGSSQVAGFPGTPTNAEVLMTAIPVAAETAGKAAMLSQSAAARQGFAALDAALSGYFALQAGKGAAESLAGAKQAFDAGDYLNTVRQLGTAGIEAAFGWWAGKQSRSRYKQVADIAKMKNLLQERLNAQVKAETRQGPAQIAETNSLVPAEAPGYNAPVATVTDTVTAPVADFAPTSPTRAVVPAAARPRTAGAAAMPGVPVTMPAPAMAPVAPQGALLPSAGVVVPSSGPVDVAKERRTEVVPGVAQGPVVPSGPGVVVEEAGTPVPEDGAGPRYYFQGVRAGRKGGESSGWWTDNPNEALSYAAKEGPGGEVLVAKVSDFRPEAFGKPGDESGEILLSPEEYAKYTAHVGLDPQSFERVSIEDFKKTHLAPVQPPPPSTEPEQPGLPTPPESKPAVDETGADPYWDKIEREAREFKASVAKLPTDPQQIEWVHGTTPEAAQAIRTGGKFTTEGVKRQYDYSEFGPDAVYFGPKDSWWYTDADGGRGIAYGETVPASLSKDAKVFTINSNADADVLAQKVGLKNGKELSNKLFVDNYTGEEGPNPKILAEAQRITRALREAGVDAIHVSGQALQEDNAIFSGPQLVVLNHAVVSPAPSAKEVIPTPASAEGAGKEPWQMTAAEWREKYGPKDTDHPAVVAEAVDRGLPVPPEVLADYPELAPKPTTQPDLPSAGTDLGSSSAPAAAPAKHEFSSTQANLPESIAKQFRAASARIPDEKLASDGRENEPHVTVKYGLHGEDAEPVRQLLADEPPITVKFGKASLFENEDADVLKVDIESEDLHRINKKIADALPNTDTHPEYKPHATIAYLKPGEGKAFAEKPVAGVTGREVTIDRIVFSGKNGEKVEIALEGKIPAPYQEAKARAEGKAKATEPWQMMPEEYSARQSKPPEVAQPTRMKSVMLNVQQLNGVKRVKAKEFALPGYYGPALAVAEYKSSRGTGYRVYLSDGGKLLEDSNGVGTLEATLKIAVQRVSNAAQRAGVEPKYLPHFLRVEAAVREGKPVPQAVLNKYPKLAPEPPTPASAAAPSQPIPQPSSTLAEEKVDTSPDLTRQLIEAEANLRSLRQKHAEAVKGDDQVVTEDLAEQIHDASRALDTLQAEAAKTNLLLVAQPGGANLPPLPTGKDSFRQQLMDEATDTAVSDAEYYVGRYGDWVEGGRKGAEPERPDPFQVDDTYPKRWNDAAVKAYQERFEAEVGKGVKEIEAEFGTPEPEKGTDAQTTEARDGGQTEQVLPAKVEQAGATSGEKAAVEPWRQTRAEWMAPPKNPQIGDVITREQVAQMVQPTIAQNPTVPKEHSGKQSPEKWAEHHAYSDSFTLAEVPMKLIDWRGPKGADEPVTDEPRTEGPIILDYNQHELGRYRGMFPNDIALDGTHRLQQARNRGDKTVLAWIGNDIAKQFGIQPSFQDPSLKTAKEQNRFESWPFGEAHRRAVEAAVAAGKPVPKEVLKDYPDLAPKGSVEAPKVTADAESTFQSAYKNELQKFASERESVYPAKELLADWERLNLTGKAEIKNGRKVAQITTETRSEGRGKKRAVIKSYKVTMPDGTSYTFDWDSMGITGGNVTGNEAGRNDWAGARALARARGAYGDQNAIHVAMMNNGDYVQWHERQYALHEALKAAMPGVQIPNFSTTVKVPANPTMKDALEAVAESIPRGLWDEPKKPWDGKYSEHYGGQMEEFLKRAEDGIKPFAAILGHDHPRVKELQQLVDARRKELSAEKTIHEQREATKRENERRAAEDNARRAAESYAKFGTEEREIGIYGHLAGWKETGEALNERALKEFGIEKKQLTPLDMAGEKLKAPDLKLLREVRLNPNGTHISRRLSIGQEADWKQRGWLDEQGIKLTELGERAVLGLRAQDASDAAGRPMSEYKPGAGKAPNPGESRFTYTAPIPHDGDVWHTDGHMLVRGNPPKYWPAPSKDSKPNPPDIARVIPKEAGETTKPVGFAVGNNGNIDGIKMVFFSNGQALNATLFDYINKLHSPDKWTSQGVGHALQAWKDGKLMGLIMPMRWGEKIDERPPRIQELIKSAGKPDYDALAKKYGAVAVEPEQK